MPRSKSRRQKVRANQRLKARRNPSIIKKRDSVENCEYCGVQFGETEYTSKTLDHIIGLAAGGLNKLSNIAIICVLCNRQKARMEQTNVRKSKNMGCVKRYRP